MSGFGKGIALGSTLTGLTVYALHRGQQIAQGALLGRRRNSSLLICCRSTNGDYNISTERKERAYAKYGLPQRRIPERLLYDNHALHYDPDKKIPLWVAEHISPATVNECEECVSLSSVFGTTGERVSRTKAHFQPDPSIPRVHIPPQCYANVDGNAIQELSSTNEDYRRSGWSRGHMAPAGDNKHSQKAMNDTFLLTNILPQDIKNNGGYWNMMEIFARDLTAKVGDVYVISGPIFRAQSEEDKEFVKYQVIGKNRVAVPTHLYKVILVDSGETTLLGAFVVPNRRLPLHIPLSNYKVPLDELEQEVGYRLFPKLERHRYADLCDSCEMMPVSEFLRIIYERKLRGARKLFWLEAQWAKAQRDQMDQDPFLRNLYETKKKELEKKTKIAEHEESVPAPA